MASNVFSNKVSLTPPTNAANPFSNAPKSTGVLGNAPKQAANPFSIALGNVASGSKPTTALKSVTTNNLDGSSSTQEYHAPAKDTASNGGLTQEQFDRNLAAWNASHPSQTPQAGLINVGDQAGPTVSPSQDVINQGNQQRYQPTAGLYGQITSDLANTARQGSLDYRNAQKELVSYKDQVAQKNADIVGTGADLNFKTGQQGALQSLAAIGTQSREQAVANALQSQQLQQQGLQQAGILSSPIQAPFTNQVLSPVTGGSIQGSNAPTPFSAGEKAGQIEAGKNYTTMSVADTAARGIKNSITSYLEQNPSLNPSDLSFTNSIAQWAQGQQLGDPKYQTLANYLNEYISTLAPILGVGGDTTNLKTEIAQSFINAKASGQSIVEVLNNIDKLASDKLANIKSAGLGGGVVSTTPPAPTSGGTGVFNW